VISTVKVTPSRADHRLLDRQTEHAHRDAARVCVRPTGRYAADRVSGYRTTEHEPRLFTSIVDLVHALLAETCGDRPHIERSSRS